MEELGIQGSLEGGMTSGSCGWVLWFAGKGGNSE